MTTDELQAYIEAYMREHPEKEWEISAAELTRRVIAIHDKVLMPRPIIERIDSGEPDTVLFRGRFRFSALPSRDDVQTIPPPGAPKA